MKMHYVFLILCLFFSEKSSQAKTVIGKKIVQVDQIPGSSYAFASLIASKDRPSGVYSEQSRGAQVVLKGRQARNDNRAKVIYLISTPRSCSTAFLRMMHARGDFEIFIEPGIKLYRNFDNKTLRDTEEAIFKKSANYQKNVFVKEMIVPASKYLLPESNFLNQQNYSIVFLIRNPHHALISFYKKNSYYKKAKKRPLSDQNDFMSYKKLYELFQKFQQKAMSPMIIQSEELVLNPRKIITQFCQYAKIPFKEESLSWQKLDGNFSLKNEWGCLYTPEIASNWYDTAMASDGLKDENLTKYAVDEHGQPTFEEIENLEHRKVYKKLYDNNMPYYKLFLDECYKCKRAKSC